MSIKATWIGKRFYRIPSSWTVFAAEGYVWHRLKGGSWVGR